MKSQIVTPALFAKLMFVFLGPLFAFAAGDSIVATTHQELADISASLPAEISLSAAKNIPQFCQVNAIRDLKESFGVQTVAFNSGGWANSFDATKESREVSFLIYFDDDVTADFDSTQKQRSTLYQVALNDLKKNSGTLSKEERATLLQGLKNIENLVSPQESSSSVGMSQTGYLCSDLTLKDVLSCSRGAKKLAKVAQAYGQEEGAMNMLPLWKKAISDPRYMTAYKNVSVRIVQSLRDGVVPSTNLFQELNNEFSILSGNRAESLEFAWNTMALIASGGGNANRRPIGIHKMGTSNREDLERSELADLFWVLSNGAMALDQVTVQRGFLYTFPSAVNNLCDYGKNYHFWMAAYLAHYLRTDGYSANVAAAASYTLEKGYQFVKLGGGRDPSKPFTQALYSNYNNNIRLDLSLAAAGAWFGAMSDENSAKSLSRAQVEQGMKLSFDGSVARQGAASASIEDFRNAQPTKLVSLYSDWKHIINPDAAFKYFADIFSR
jgi:hypothetical protein